VAEYEVELLTLSILICPRQLKVQGLLQVQGVLLACANMCFAFNFNRPGQQIEKDHDIAKASFIDIIISPSYLGLWKLGSYCKSSDCSKPAWGVTRRYVRKVSNLSTFLSLTTHPLCLPEPTASERLAIRSHVRITTSASLYCLSSSLPRRRREGSVAEEKEL